MEGRAASRDQDAPRRTQERPAVEVAQAGEGLLRESGLAPDHVVHVERVAGPRVRESDHAGGMRGGGLNVAAARVVRGTGTRGARRRPRGGRRRAGPP